MLAMLTDSIAVMGRHLGLPLIGSIEIFRMLGALAACAAIVLATLANSHAHVHFLTDRLPKVWQRGLEMFGYLVSAVFAASLAVGSAWLFLEKLPGNEESEVIRLPYPPFRLIAVLTVVIVAVVFAYNSWKRPKS